MWSKIWHRLTTTIAGGAIIIALASITSRVFGLVRDRLLASHFGAGNDLDIYYAAFRIPDLIFNVLILGALSAAFIPVFVEYLQRAKEHPEQKAEAWALVNSLLNILLIGLVVFGIVFYIFAPVIMPLIAPGFSQDKQVATVHLTRIMLVAIIFFGVSNIFTGILNSFKRYIAFAMAPIMYNIGIIIGIIWLVPRYGLVGLAYGVVLGAAMHMLVQLPGVMRVGYRYAFMANWRHSGVRLIGKLMLPRTFGLAVAQVDQLVSLIIGSTLVVGSVAVFNFANNLQNFPINVFGVSIAVASFPYFSEASAQKNVGLFVQYFSKNFRRILFVVIPVSVLFILLRAQFVRVVLGTGAFDWDDTRLTAQTLGFFSLSLFAQSLVPLLARSFYAWHDTKTPVKVAVISLVADIVGAVILSRFMGVEGLALAFSIASFINMILLYLLLRKKLGQLDDHAIFLSIIKIVFISLIMGVIVQAAKYFLALGINMQTFVGVFIQGIGAASVGLFVYLVLALVFKCDEITIISEWLKKAKKQISNGSNEPNGATHNEH
ncbi:MAG: murein biosynthesis integral membrane protein MurJ [Patescibacteria group bacterium]